MSKFPMCALTNGDLCACFLMVWSRPKAQLMHSTLLNNISILLKGTGYIDISLRVFFKCFSFLLIQFENANFGGNIEPRHHANYSRWLLERRCRKTISKTFYFKFSSVFLIMPLIKLKHISSFSSEDTVGRKWCSFMQYSA